MDNDNSVNHSNIDRKVNLPMAPTVMLLVAIAAALHVLWNVLVKTSLDKPAFALLTSFSSFLMITPFYLAMLFSSAPMKTELWWYAALSGLFEAVYTISLFQAYKEGDLSVVYPLSRGAAPLFTLLLGGVLIGDTIIVTHGIAVAVVISGVLAVSFSAAAHTRAGLKRSGILIAIFTGMMIAGYHLVDRAAMSHADTPDPIEYLFAMHLFLVLFVALWVVFVGCRWRHISDEWHANRRSVLIVGFCVPFAYLFIIVALKMGNVTHVAAARNVGIVFSTAVGWLFLKESVTCLRAVGALLIALGITGLVLFDNITY